MKVLTKSLEPIVGPSGARALFWVPLVIVALVVGGLGVHTFAGCSFEDYWHDVQTLFSAS